MCKCQLFSPSRDTIYRHQKYGRCALKHKYIYEVDKATCTDFCTFIGWTDPPRFEKCNPTKRGPKAVTTSTTAFNTYQLPAGFKIPKKDAPATSASLEEGEVVSSDEEGSKSAVASIIVRTKRARSPDSSARLRQAIELLEGAEQLEKRAKHMREEARRIRQSTL